MWMLIGALTVAGAFSMAGDCEVDVEDFPGGFFVNVDDDD